jgi:hypothetical protein
MSRTTTTAEERRAARLLRWYPKTWRSRYGDEFVELLTSEFVDRPVSLRRTANVAWSGTVARLTRVGLTSHPLEPSEQVRAGLVSLGCALAVFIALGAAMLSQLTIGWQWARPNTMGTTAAMVVMSAMMFGFVVLAVLAAVPVVTTVLNRIIRREAQGLVRPFLLLVLGASLVTIGARHFGNGWPGTGGHPWAHQGLVPGGVAAFLWASTLSISSYWAHPAALVHFPPAEVAWMVVSPLAMVSAIVGMVKIVRRLDMSPQLLRYERRIGTVAASAMAIFLAGTCCWVVDGGPGPRNLFHAGAIDVSGLALMAAASLVGLRALHQTRSLGASRLAR